MSNGDVMHAYYFFPFCDGILLMMDGGVVGESCDFLF